VLLLDEAEASSLLNDGREGSLLNMDGGARKLVVDPIDKSGISTPKTVGLKGSATSLDTDETHRDLYDSGGIFGTDAECKRSNEEVAALSRLRPKRCCISIDFTATVRLSSPASQIWVLHRQCGTERRQFFHLLGL
jgi:hypothetical protein